LEYEIYESKFENITLKNALPLVADSKYSEFTIKDTIFRDLK